MQNSRNNHLFSITISSIPLTTIAFAGLLCAKLFTAQGAALSWWVVTCPLWLPWAFVFAFFAFWYLLAIICFAVGYTFLGLAMACQWIGKKIKQIFRKNWHED